MNGCKILEGIFDRSPYRYIMDKMLWTEAKEELFQELLDNGVINIKTIVAFDVISDAKDGLGLFANMIDRRKFKRCKRYFKKHMIDYDDLLDMVNARFNMKKEDQKTICKLFEQMMFGGR